MSIKVTPDFLARSISFRVGLVVLVVLAGVLYLTFKAQTGMPFAKTTEVKAVVSNVHSLKANDAVRQNSKRIGKVKDIEYRDGSALVTMELDGDVDVYQDASAAVWDLSALATKFVELDLGTPKSGELGSEAIPAAQTEDSADLYQLLDVLDPKTRDAATQMLRQVGAGAAGHGQDLGQFVVQARDLLDDLGAVSKSLADPDADLTALLQNADLLASRFHGREDEIADLVHQTDQTLEAVATDSGTPLRETINRLPSALSDVKGAMDSLQAPLARTGSAMRALEPGAKSLSNSEQNLRGFLREAVPVAKQVPGVAGLAVPAVDDLTSTLSDARPLAPEVRQAVGDLLEPLRVLSYYSTDMAQLFLRGKSFVSQGPNPGVRYARLGVTPGVNTVTGGLLRSGNLPQNQYPAPGEAQYDRAQGLPPGLPGKVTP
ncbi:MlaD family protein [Nocardioides jensenii]|uniref:MlaD family protein n=1 Tax=Nocardioides jensenii TaxID=1843 RepID=UPI0008354735|nr:MlaD family protein [Nocardioides jensenii]